MCDEMLQSLDQFEDLNEADIEALLQKPWAKRLLDNVLVASKKGVLHWCNFVSKIGEHEVNTDEYVSTYLAKVERRHLKLILDIEQLHEKYLDRLMQLLHNMEKVCKDLHVPMPSFDLKADVAGGAPLGQMYHNLKKKCEEYEAEADKRREELKALQNKQKDLCANLGRQPQMLLPETNVPTGRQLEDLKDLVDRLESEKMDREERFFVLKEEICQLIAELQVQPELDFEKKVLSTNDQEVLISDHHMTQLEAFHRRLVNQKKAIKEEIHELRMRVDDMWDKLDVDIVQRDQFRTMHSGNSVPVLEALRQELRRLDRMRKANIESFVTVQRQKLWELWEKCRLSQDQRDNFAFYRSDIYTEDLLDLHEMELAKWTQYYEQNKELFKLLKDHEKMWQDWLQLERSSDRDGAARYKNRGGKLLAEEKIRNKLTKRLPQIEECLYGLADEFLEREGRPFLIDGETVHQYMAKLYEERDKEKQDRLSAKKLQRSQQQQQQTTLTPARSRLNLFPPSSGRATPQSFACNTLVPTPGKRKLLTTPRSAVATATAFNGLSAAKRKRLSNGSVAAGGTRTGATAASGKSATANARRGVFRTTPAAAAATASRAAVDKQLPTLNVSKTKRLSAARRKEHRERARVLRRSMMRSSMMEKVSGKGHINDDGDDYETDNDKENNGGGGATNDTVTTDYNKFTKEVSARSTAFGLRDTTNNNNHHMDQGDDDQELVVHHVATSAPIKIIVTQCSTPRAVPLTPRGSPRAPSARTLAMSDKPFAPI